MNDVVVVEYALARACIILKDLCQGLPSWFILIFLNNAAFALEAPVRHTTHCVETCFRVEAFMPIRIKGTQFLPQTKSCSRIVVGGIGENSQRFGAVPGCQFNLRGNVF